MSLFDWLRGKQQGGDFDAPGIAPAPSLLPPAVMSPPPPPAYSIENAIDLMRSLPFDENPELVLRVLRKTLRSTGVSVEQIIDAARSREQALTAEGSAQVAAIEQLEQQIVARRAEIERLAASLNETKSARERLQRAMENETKVAPLPPDVVLQIREEVKAEKEAAARAESTAPPPIAAATHAPAGQVPPAPKSMPPPLPKSVAPPLPSSRPSPSKPAPQSRAPRSVRPPAVAASRADAAVPSLVADDGDEQTDNLQEPPNGRKK